jgi:glycosyltransferase involved in cell wall biosynthesis
MDLLPYDILRLRFWWNEGWKKGLEIHGSEGFDVVHCHDLDTLPIGVKLKKRIGMPLIYDAHEIWGYMLASELPGLMVNYYLRKEKRILRNVDGIITVADTLKDYFKSFSKVNIVVIMNCKSVLDTDYEPPRNERFTLIYVGSLGSSRFLIELAEVVKDMPETLCIIGGIGKPKYVNELRKLCASIPNVDFRGRIPFDDVIPMTKGADAVVCMFNPDDKLTRIGLPNKVFEAMVCGRPIIVSKNTYLGQFVEKNGVGISVDYSKEGLRKGISLLRDREDLRVEFGRIALEKAKVEYNWDSQAKKLLKVYDDLVKTKP